MSAVHLPVLTREMLDLLSPREGGTYIDATVGLGGHSEALLKTVGINGRVIGIDRDEEALKKTEERLQDSRLSLIKGKFSDMEDLLHDRGIHEADGVLFDLGVSMMQLKETDRGFSFISSETLDMRMDRSQGLSARDVVNRYSEKDLVRVLKEYGEEYRALRVARAITNYRDKKSIDTGEELADIVLRALGRRGRTHPATKTFQALRIEVNREIEELRLGLQSALRLLTTGGRFCVISYHSLEDRVVKNFIRDNARNAVLRPLVKKPLTPERQELRENPSSRSAKMRGAEKL